MSILALDTALDMAGVGLKKNNAPCAEYVTDGSRQHAETIMAMADKLMAEHNVLPGDLTAIAVDIGPGSFTGVRIGVCVANAMVQALDIPLISANSLSILYELVRGEKAVCPMIDARNGFAYLALYEGGREVFAPCAVPVSEFLKTVPKGTLFLGNGAFAYKAEIKSFVEGAVFAPEYFSILRPAMLINIAERIIKNGGAQKGVYASPLYLRKPQAERVYEEQRKDSL